MTEYRYLFSPIKLGSTVIPNRINFAAHMTNLSVDQKISEAHIEYYLARARGGCGLITTEELTVHPSDHAYERLVDAYEPGVVPSFQALTKKIHEYDTKLFAQLNHNGSQADGTINRMPVWGPSPDRDPIFREICKEMEPEEIRECADYFAKSAVNVVEGGFDGIELQLGHSSLIRQFLSPASNRRKDDYGGSFRNRMRFCLEVIESVRKAVGPDFTCGVRLNADEMHPMGGLTLEDTKRIAMEIEKTGWIDFFDISLGTFYNLFLVEGSMHTPLGYTVPLSAGIRSVVDLPVYCTNRINDPHLAETILEKGHGDMINMVRALIADPDLPNKARQGRDEDIRHCIACNQGCIGRMAQGYSIGCVQNPSAGREMKRSAGPLINCEKHKKVLVIGGGPAGLEAARVSALRKHWVVLFEKEDEPGGQNILAGKVSGRQEITGITRWLMSQVRKLDIDIRLGTKADQDLILNENPDAVVMATGSVPKMNPFPGGYGPPHVVNSWQILKNEVEPGKKVLLVDLEGHHQSTGTAEYLADMDRQVHIITPTLFIGARLGPLQDLFLSRKRLAMKGVTFRTDIAVLEIQGTLVKALQVYSGEMIDYEGYDTIVLVAGNVSEDQLYFDLKGKVKELYRIGDCVAPRKTDMAIMDGNRIGRLL